MRSETKAGIAAVICGVVGVVALSVLVPEGASARGEDLTVPLPGTTATVPAPPLPETTLPTVSTPTVTVPTVTVPTVPTTTVTVTVPTVTVPTVTVPTTTTTRSGGGGGGGGGTTTTVPGPTTTAAAASPTPKPATTQPPSTPSAKGKPFCRSRGGLPDRRCTPGGTAKGYRLARTCAAGQRRAAAPAPALRVASAVFAAYGIPAGARAGYRLDRLISAELGGSRLRANLWPQPTKGRLSAAAKDHTEAYLLRLVCRGKLSLRQARVKLTRNWVAVYRSLPRGAR
jgi:hypothetical protein